MTTRPTDAQRAEWTTVNAVFTHPDDEKAGEAIGLGNALGDIEICEAYDMPASEDYEQGIVRALRPLVEQRLRAAARSLLP